MPRSPTRWLAWARDNLFRPARPRPGRIALGYERGGAVAWAAPVPWTADAAVLELELALRPSARRKTDFAVRLPAATFPADALRADDRDRCRVSFRFPLPADTAEAVVLWRNRPVARANVAVLTPKTFLGSLSTSGASVAARFAGTTVAASAVGADRCEGLLASAVLRCPTGLAPLAELGLRAVFHDATAGAEHSAAVALGQAQLAQTETAVLAVCPAAVRGEGVWWVSWAAGERTLTTQRVRVMSNDQFEAGVRVLEARFALCDSAGELRTSKTPPAPGEAGRVGPSFVLVGSEPGGAAVCRFEVVAFAAGGEPLARHGADAVVTDGPSVFAPVLFEAADLARVSGFELRLGGRVLAVASLRPVPAARLTAEGGFVPPPEFSWTAAADDELADRLRRLSG